MTPIASSSPTPPQFIPSPSLLHVVGKALISLGIAFSTFSTWAYFASFNIPYPLAGLIAGLALCILGFQLLPKTPPPPPETPLRPPHRRALPFEGSEKPLRRSFSGGDLTKVERVFDPIAEWQLLENDLKKIKPFGTPMTPEQRLKAREICFTAAPQASLPSVSISSRLQNAFTAAQAELLLEVSFETIEPSITSDSIIATTTTSLNDFQVDISSLQGSILSYEDFLWASFSVHGKKVTSFGIVTGRTNSQSCTLIREKAFLYLEEEITKNSFSEEGIFHSLENIMLRLDQDLSPAHQAHFLLVVCINNQFWTVNVGKERALMLTEEHVQKLNATSSLAGDIHLLGSRRCLPTITRIPIPVSNWKIALVSTEITPSMVSSDQILELSPKLKKNIGTTIIHAARQSKAGLFPMTVIEITSKTLETLS